MVYIVPPAKQETWVRSLDQEDPLEEEMATHSSILPGKSNPWAHKESDMNDGLTGIS